MSLVCHKWFEGYGSPSVLKTFRFSLIDSQLSMDTCLVIKIVRKYSIMFQHVEIHYDIIMNNHLIYTLCQQFKLFLEILTSNWKLISVKFRDFVWLFADTDTRTYGDVIRAIISFLGSQHYLKRVEFDQCFFGYQEGVEILKNLTQSSRDSLNHLVIRGFVPSEPKNKEQDSTAEQNLTMLLDLPHLKSLETDYLFIFENTFPRHSEVTKTSKNCETRVLSKIILNYDGDSIDIECFRGLTSTDWLFLKQLYTDLQVELNFTTHSSSRRELELLIAPCIPITRLDYTNYAYHMRIEYDVLFDHLLACKINDHLIALRLEWILPIQDLDFTFTSFLQAYKKLKYLELFNIRADDIDPLMESWQENRPESLEKVVIDISYIQDEDDYASLMNLTNEYVSLLELFNVDTSLRQDCQVAKQDGRYGKHSNEAVVVKD
ncbi:hypothetical protein AVEN_171563-1 [Araneus ventricosus]|uniref:Uncharacterized protein n=1 Tax=Araneus ventricosus TaxID=182803 RepID=A0A4Y2K0A4_ARAVE|nr:hypothetical protein AVEN_171563-1 [Araneus ventricosus]